MLDQKEESWKEARERNNKATDNLNKYLLHINETLIDYYQKITLYSGGAIILSITFLGYLKNIPGHRFNSILLLLVAWTALIFALISSLLRNYYYASHIHYSLMKKWVETGKELKKREADLIKTRPGQIFGEIKPLEFANELERKAEEFEKATRSHEKNVGKYNKLLSFSQKSAHIAFVTGIVALSIFALLNIL